MRLLRSSFKFLKKEERLGEIIDLLKRLEPVREWIFKHSDYNDELIEDIIGILEEFKDIPTWGVIPSDEKKLIESAHTLIQGMRKE